MTYALWVLQSLLAVLFLLVGGIKLIAPLDEASAQMGVPGTLILMVGVAEVLGALGLVLPGLLKIRTGLTSLAALGLALITLGATVLHIAQGDVLVATFPLVIAGLSAFVAYGRWRLVPPVRPSKQRTLQPSRYAETH